MNTIMVLLLITSQTFLQEHLFWKNGKSLFLGNKKVATLTQGDFFVSQNLRYAAVYDFASRKLSLLNPDGTVWKEVEAINPVVRIDDGGDFAVFEPELSRFRVFSASRQSPIEYRDRHMGYTDEAYSAFDVNPFFAAFSISDRGRMYLKVWNLQNGHLVYTYRFPDTDIYPANLWIDESGLVVLRTYAVRNGQFEGEKLVFIWPENRKIGFLSIRQVLHLAFGENGIYLATKHAVYRVNLDGGNPYIADSADIANFIKDIRLIDGKCYIMTASPVWRDGRTMWQNPSLLEWDDGVKELVTLDGAAVFPSIIVDNGEVGLWIPSEGIVLKGGRR